MKKFIFKIITQIALSLALSKGKSAKMSVNKKI